MALQKLSDQLPEFRPGTDPPGAPVLATAEEQADADQRKRATRYTAKIEQWVKARFVSFIGVGMCVLKKNAAPYNPDGQHYYASQTLVDLSGTVVLWLNGAARTVPLDVEVKSFGGRSWPLSSLKPKQRALLSKRRLQGRLVVVALVRHEKGKIQEAWFIPWRGEGQPRGTHITARDWDDLEKHIAHKAEQSLRFHGMSVRLEDLALMCESRVKKEGGRWEIPLWLGRLTTVEQPELL